MDSLFQVLNGDREGLIHKQRRKLCVDAYFGDNGLIVEIDGNRECEKNSVKIPDIG